MTTLGKEIRRLERHVARGDTQRALKGYERLLAQMPRDPVLRNRVGFLRNLLHRHAPDWQVRTYVISPRAVAEAHVMGKRYAEALELLESLLEQDPGDSGLARRVAMVRALRDGCAEDGLEPTASTHVMSPEMLVEAHLAGGEVESALNLLRRLALRRPDDERLRRRIEALAAAWDAERTDEPTGVTQVPVPRPGARVEAPPPLPGRDLEAQARTAPPLPTLDDLPRLDAQGRPPPPAIAAPGASDPDLDDDEDREASGPRFDTAVLATLLERARAVIREYAPAPEGTTGTEADAPDADLPTLADVAAPPLPPRAPAAELPPPLPARAPAPARPPRPEALPTPPAAAGAVRAVRRQSAPARGGRDATADLLSGDPHKTLDGKLLGSPEGQIDARSGADWDIHEMLTETGTKPGIKLPAAPPLSLQQPYVSAAAAPPAAEAPVVAPPPPPPPRRAPPVIPPGTVEYEEMARFARPGAVVSSGELDPDGPMAAAEDFEDASTMNYPAPDAERPRSTPSPAAPLPPAPVTSTVSRLHRGAADLFDEADDPTLLDASPLRAGNKAVDDNDEATLAHEDPRRSHPVVPKKGTPRGKP